MGEGRWYQFLGEGPQGGEAGGDDGEMGFGGRPDYDVVERPWVGEGPGSVGLIRRGGGGRIWK